MQSASEQFIPLDQLDRDQFFAQMKPSLDQFLSENKSDLEGATINQQEILNNMYDLVHGSYAITQLSVPTESKFDSTGVLSLATVAADTFSIFLHVVGVKDTVTTAIANSVVGSIGKSGMSQLQTYSDNIANASDGPSQAIAVLQFAFKIYESTGWGTLYNALNKNLGLADVIIIGATLFLEIKGAIQKGPSVLAGAIVSYMQKALEQTVADAVKLQDLERAYKKFDETTQTIPTKNA